METKRSRAIVYYDEHDYKDIKEYAKSKGLNVSSFLKFAARDYMGCGAEPKKGKKTISLPISNYEELQNYIDIKCLGTIETFACYAMKCFMNKNQLTQAQKLQADKNLA